VHWLPVPLAPQIVRSFVDSAEWKRMQAAFGEHAPKLIGSLPLRFFDQRSHRFQCCNHLWNRGLVKLVRRRLAEAVQIAINQFDDESRLSLDRFARNCEGVSQL
jgi:hypothetical protein